MVHICSFCQFNDGTIEKEIFESPYSNFNAAVNDELLFPTPENEKEELLRCQVYYWRGLADFETMRLATLTLLASSNLVIKSTLDTYFKNKTFGIIVSFKEGECSHQVLCMPIDSWYLIISKLNKQ